MSDAPPPSSAPLLEEKHGPPPSFGIPSPAVTQPQSIPGLPPDIGPPPYEPVPQPGFIHPHIPTEGGMPYMPHGYYPPPGSHVPMGYYPPTSGHYTSPSGHTATVIVPSGAATTVTVLQGEIFQATPVQTVCSHCQQAIITSTSHEIGMMNFLLCCFCCAVGCDLGCCLIPFVMDEFKDVMHICPNCKAYIYTYKRTC